MSGSRDPGGKAPMVVALGGNAISAPDQDDNIASQFAQTRRTARVLADLLQNGTPVVITHGNGPQIGSALRRNELSSSEIYMISLEVLVADLQGGMGYMIGQCVANELQRRGVTRVISTLVTTVVVDDDDPAFTRPTKPIGPFYGAERARELQSEAGWVMGEIPGRGFRRLVPSPLPRAIVEIDVIRQLVASGASLVAAGGGGIPVVRDGTGSFHGRDAVIDKDRAAALLALGIGADTLLIVTAVEKVAIDYGTPAERRLDRLSLAEARRHLKAGQFPAGSMGPKIEAAIAFLEQSEHDRARVIITDIPRMGAALAGRGGTALTRSESDSRRTAPQASQQGADE